MVAGSGTAVAFKEISGPASPVVVLAKPAQVAATAASFGVTTSEDRLPSC